MADQTLVPAYVKFVYDKTELLIVDVSVSLKFSNGSSFEESMTEKGTKGYMLRKGITTEQDGDIFVRITKAGDGGADTTIKNLQTIMKNISKSEDPKDYAKDIVMSFADSSGQVYLVVSLCGFLYTLKILDTNNNNFTDFIAGFKTHDSSSIKFSR